MRHRTKTMDGDKHFQKLNSMNLNNITINNGLITSYGQIPKRSSIQYRTNNLLLDKDQLSTSLRERIHNKPQRVIYMRKQKGSNGKGKNMIENHKFFSTRYETFNQRSKTYSNYQQKDLSQLFSDGSYFMGSSLVLHRRFSKNPKERLMNFIQSYRCKRQSFNHYSISPDRTPKSLINFKKIPQLYKPKKDSISPWEVIVE